MRLLVVGAGAIGGYFGGRLAMLGRDVTFFVRCSRAAQLRADGLQVISPHGDFRIVPKTVTADIIDAPFDAVLLAVKAYSLDTALADCAPAIGERTTILPLLNGMKHVTILQERFGTRNVLGSLCKISAARDEDGRIVQLARGHELIYGEMDGTVSTRIQEIDSFMQGADFTARLSREIELEMWSKWVLIASVCAITCLMRGSIGEVEAVPGGSDFALAVFEEATSTATALGYLLGHEFLSKARAVLTKPSSSMASSLYRDLQQGNRIESDQIIGDFVARAKSVGIATPLLSVAHTALCIYERRLRSSGNL